MRSLRNADAVASAPPSAGSFALLAVLALLWGTNWPAMKIVVGDMPIATFRLLCLWTGGPALLAIAALSGERLRVPRGERRPLALAAFLNITLWHIGSAAGVYFMEASRASIIAFTMPVWAALFGTLFLGERLTAARLAGLALGLAGLGVLVLPDLSKMTAAPIGVAFMLLAAMSWALGTVVVKARSWSLSTAQLTGWQLVIGGIPIAAAAPLTDPPPSVANLNTETLLVLAYILVFPMIVAQWSWFRLLKLLPAGIAAIGTLAVPVTGVLSSALFLGEPIGLSEITGLFLVLAALAVVLFDPPLRAERS